MSYLPHSEEVFEGEWRRGMRCGQGRMSYAARRILDGDATNDALMYVGQWLADARHGKGCMQYR
jgi:hypothetical protein